MKKRFILMTVAITAFFVTACEELPPELIEPTNPIPVPTNVSIVGGSQSATIDWEFDSSFAFSDFVIYRSEDNVTYTEVDRRPAPPHTDTNLRTGITYWYRIAGVDESGVIGRRSSATPITVAIYEVMVNGGASVTKDADVTVSFTAPSFSQNVRVSEDPSMADVQWLDFSPAVTFILSNGDGTKTIYAEFADGTGNRSEVISTTIKLDTFAQIETLSFSPSTVAPGGTVHLVVRPTAGELNGDCEVFIEGQGDTPVVILDKGTNGDIVAGDGVYEIDYTFPEFFRKVRMKMSAVFFDEAGNGSAEVEFASNLLMSDPPVAVSLLTPAHDVTVSSITLRFTASDDLHFSSYEIYRSLTLPIDPDLSTLAGRVTQSDNTMFTDEDLDEGVSYNYAVFVVNDLDEKTGSNTESFSTSDLAPTPVTLDAPSSVATDRLTLTWSMNDNTDFVRYEIRFSTSPGVDEGSLLAGTITDQLTTFFDHTGLDTGVNTYYYRVFVVDAAGNSARSNETNTP